MGKVSSYRFDSNRFGGSAAIQQGLLDIVPNHRRKVEGKWEDLQEAMTQAVEKAAEAGQEHIIALDRRDTDAMLNDFTYKVVARNKKNYRASFGWVKRSQRYYDWQERGTLGNRSTGRFRDTGKTKASGGSNGTGIKPMYALPIAEEAFKSELESAFRSIRG